MLVPQGGDNVHLSGKVIPGLAAELLDPRTFCFSCREDSAADGAVPARFKFVLDDEADAHELSESLYVASMIP